MDWFDAWIIDHCTATGAGENVVPVLAANRDVFVNVWRASGSELRDCTCRLVQFLRVPKFPADHAEAVGRELMQLRKERVRESRDDPGEFPSCLICGDGRGWVVVPHPRCVWHGELANWPGSASIRTVAVICEDCDAGRKVLEKEQTKEIGFKRPTVSRYRRMCHGADGIAMLRQHEAERAERARAGGPVGGDLGPTLAGLLRKAV